MCNSKLQKIFSKNISELFVNKRKHYINNSNDGHDDQDDYEYDHKKKDNMDVNDNDF